MSDHQEAAPPAQVAGEQVPSQKMVGSPELGSSAAPPADKDAVKKATGNVAATGADDGKKKQNDPDPKSMQSLALEDRRLGAGESEATVAYASPDPDRDPVASETSGDDGLWAKLCRASQDIEDFDRRIIVAVQRVGLSETAVLLAAELGGTAFLRSDVRAGAEPANLAAIKAAMEAAIASEAPASPIFIEELHPSDRPGDLGRLFEQTDNGAFAELAGWLAERRARLVVMVEAAMSDLRPQRLEFLARRRAGRLAGCYWLPWTELWLRNACQALGLTFSPSPPLQQKLLAAETAGKLEPDKERALIETLTECLDKLQEGSAGIRIGTTTFEDRIGKAVADAKSGAEYGDKARVLLKAIFADEPPAGVLGGAGLKSGGDQASEPQRPTYGDIGRTTLIVFAYLNAPNERVLLRLVRALLPNGEPPAALLPSDWRQELARARFVRSAADQAVGTSIDPPVMTWSSLFDRVETSILPNLGLKVETSNTGNRSSKVLPDLSVTAGAVLAAVNLQEFLGTRATDVRLLVDRILDRTDARQRREPFRCLPVELRQALADLMMGIRATFPTMISMNELVAAFTGLAAGRRTFQIPADVVRTQLDSRFLFYSAGIERVGDVLRSIQQDAQLLAPERHRIEAVSPDGVHLAAEFEDEADRRRLEAEQQQLAVRASTADEALRIHAAGEIHRLLDPASQFDPKPGEFLAAFLAVVAEGTDPTSLWLLIAYLVLYGPMPDPAAVGALTLAPFVDQTYGDFASRMRDFRDILNAMVRGAESQAGRVIAPYDRWADAIWSVAERPAYARIGVPIAVYLDDLLSTAEIPWRPLLLDDRRPHPPTLASQFLLHGRPRSGPDLLERLFARPAEAHADALLQLSRIHRSSPAVVFVDQVFARLNDVFHVLFDEIDETELAGWQHNLPKYQALVWREVGAAYGVLAGESSHDCARAIAEVVEEARRAERRDIVALLDLYPVAVLLFWRFRLWQAQPLTRGSEEDRAFSDRLDRILGAIGQRRAAVQLAFRAIAAAEQRLVEQFEISGAVRTAARHQQRLARIRAITVRFGSMHPVIV